MAEACSSLEQAAAQPPEATDRAALHADLVTIARELERVAAFRARVASAR